MTKTDATRLRVVVFLAPVALGFACVKRDWSFCTPQDPCLAGFVCTVDWRCVRANDGGTTDVATDGAVGQDSSSGGAQDQPGGDASASIERGSDVPGSTVAEPNVDAAGPMAAETSVDAMGSTAIETGAEVTLASDAANPDILHAPDAPSAATDLSPTLDAQSSASDVPGAPLDAAMAADTAPPGSPLGFVCLRPSDCASGYCSDGVCCNSVCLGACQSCALVGKAGTCSDVTGSPAPGHPACGGIGTCAGSCSGQSASCSFPDAKTICGVASCANGTAYSAPTCDGAGTCGLPKSTPCGTFACGTTACLSSCSDSSQCVVGAACVNSKMRLMRGR